MIAPCTGQTLGVEKCATADEVKEVVRLAKQAQEK